MGILYIKVIESKKVAVRSSFFVNYPFIRLRIGKQKKDTSFKPGVEWWDKIYSFKEVSPSTHIVLTAQARDKSIHVFGSDWLGEVNIKLNDLMDGDVHQGWYKLGKGNKNHTRSPRGYIHIAFHYFDTYTSGKRPFSTAPVERVMPFEDWLAANGVASDNSFFSTNTSDINPSESTGRLRQSAPAVSRSPYSSDASPEDRKSHISQKPKSKSTNQLPETRPRSRTVPTDSRRSAADSDDENSDAESASSYEDDGVIPTANLIDFSFDEPKKKNGGLARSNTGLDIFNKESPVRFSPKAGLSRSETALPTSAPTVAPMVAPADVFHKLSQDPAFEDWYNPPKDAKVVSTYNPQNPFLALHDSHAPTFSVKN